MSLNEDSKTLTIVKQIKVVIIDRDSKRVRELSEDDRKLLIKSQYQFIRDAQYNQAKAFNLAMTYLTLGYFKGGKDFKSEEYKDAKRGLKTSNPIFEDVHWSRGVDIGSAMCRKVVKDFEASVKNGLARGERSITNYKRTMALVVRGRSLKIKQRCINSDDIIIDWVNNVTFKCILGWKKNGRELKVLLNKIIVGEYKVCTSSLMFNNKNELILNLTITVPKNPKNVIVEGRTLGVDLGLENPVYMSVSDNIYLRQSVGSFKELAKQRVQFKQRGARLRKQLHLQNGVSKENKLKELEALKGKERAFARTYHHKLSKKVVEYAKKNGCEYINLEKITIDTQKKRVEDIIDIEQLYVYMTEDTKDKIRKAQTHLWGYYALQSQIEYKAEKEGIKVRYVKSENTSQKCSSCGNISKENRISSSEFKCVHCGKEIHADWNASINIANSGEFVTKVEKKVKKV